MPPGFYKPASIFDAESPFFSFCASMPLKEEHTQKLPTIDSWPTTQNFQIEEDTEEDL